MERRQTGVSRVGIGALFQQPERHCHLSTRRRHQERRAARREAGLVGRAPPWLGGRLGLRARVHIGPRSQQDAGALDVAAAGGEVEGREPFPGVGLQVGAGLDQHLQYLRVHFGRSPHQGGLVLCRLPGVDARPRSEEPLHGLGIASAGTRHERRLTCCRWSVQRWPRLRRAPRPSRHWHWCRRARAASSGDRWRRWRRLPPG